MDIPVRIARKDMRLEIGRRNNQIVLANVYVVEGLRWRCADYGEHELARSYFWIAYPEIERRYLASCETPLESRGLFFRGVWT